MEDRSGSKEGMQAVLNVVMNRARNPRWWGDSPASVCLKPMQFSSWNVGSTQIPLVKTAIVNNDAVYAVALNLAQLALQGILPDTTLHADSYFAASIEPPSWATPDKFTVEIMGQRFYRLELSPY
jgi:hypothetical protein